MIFILLKCSATIAAEECLRTAPFSKCKDLFLVITDIIIEDI